MGKTWAQVQSARNPATAKAATSAGVSYATQASSNTKYRSPVSKKKASSQVSIQPTSTSLFTNIYSNISGFTKNTSSKASTTKPSTGLFSSMLSGISNLKSSITSKVSSSTKTLSETAKGLLNKITSIPKNVTTTVKGGASSAFNFGSGVFNKGVTNLSNLIQSVPSRATGFVGTVKDKSLATASTIYNKIKDLGGSATESLAQATGKFTGAVAGGIASQIPITTIVLIGGVTLISGILIFKK